MNRKRNLKETLQTDKMQSDRFIIRILEKEITLIFDSIMTKILEALVIFFHEIEQLTKCVFGTIS